LVSHTWAVSADARGNATTATCEHLGAAQAASPETVAGCEDCLREGTRWVHLRECLVCGHIGCCDNSPRKHATAHWHATDHPMIRSVEPGEQWGWCYVDNVYLAQAG
jgi:hypothetical protein